MVKSAVLDAFHIVGSGLWMLCGITAGFNMYEFRHIFVLIKSHAFCSTLDLQLSFYCPFFYNSRAHCSLLQCLRTASAILAGAHSYFVVSSFKFEGKNCYHDIFFVFQWPPTKVIFLPEDNCFGQCSAHSQWAKHRLKQLPLGKKITLVGGYWKMKIILYISTVNSHP